MEKQKNIIANDILKEWRSNPNSNIAYDLCNKAKHGRIHHLLFLEIVFPVIKDGINNNIERDVIAGIKCIQNFSNDKKAWAQIGFASESILLKRLIKTGNKNEWVIEKYFETSINWLKYCIHEWPSGVLYGINGANIMECDEIIRLIYELHEMNIYSKYLDILADVKDKTLIYQQKLRAQQGDRPEPVSG